MSPKEKTALYVDADLLEAMRDVKAREGIPISTQIEMAVREWLSKRKGITVKKPERKRADTRRRS